MDEWDESPERATQKIPVLPLQGSSKPAPFPGFQSSLRSLFHPGLCCSALSALIKESQVQKRTPLGVLEFIEKTPGLEDSKDRQAYVDINNVTMIVIFVPGGNFE
jgi:hypothetical protein